MTKENHDLRPFAKFHGDNRGFNFKNVNNGYVYTKLDMWEKFQHSDRDLQMLTSNCHPQYTRIDKPDWKDGILKVQPNLKK
jgi:hypothetical protein